MIGVIVVEVMRMAWFVERRVWWWWWKDHGSAKRLFESDVGGWVVVGGWGDRGCCDGGVVGVVVKVVVIVAWLALWLRWLL